MHHRAAIACLASTLACGSSSSAPGASDSGDTTSATAGGEGSSTASGDTRGGSTTAADDASTTGIAPPDAGVAPGPARWHVESPADSARTWLVSPSGERVFWLGVNTVMRDKQCDGILDWIRRTDPTTAARVEWARLSDGTSGDEVDDAPYCFNSVGGFSDTNDFGDDGRDSWMIRSLADGGAGAPYGVVLDVAAHGDDRALRSGAGVVLSAGFADVRIGDPFNPAFAADLSAMVAEDVAPRVADENLQMWFAGNEIGIFDAAGHGGGGIRDLRHWIWSACPEGSTIDAPACAPHGLAAFLRARYVDVAALDAAWEVDYTDWLDVTVTKPRPYVGTCNQICREDLQRFVHDELLARWVALVTGSIRAVDPDHLITTPRLALARPGDYRFWSPASSDDPDTWFDTPGVPVPTDGDVTYCPFDLFARDGDTGFDLVAVNVYDGVHAFAEPWLGDGLGKLHERSGLPVIVSEFSVRARISGWSNRGGAAAFVPTDDTDDQIQRGAYYREQIEQLAAMPFVLGASWHAWSDRYLAADAAHQIDMGLVRCDDAARGFVAGARWPEIDDRIADTNCNIMDRIAALTGL